MWMQHYNANTVHKELILTPGDLNWVQHWVSRIGLLTSQLYSQRVRYISDFQFRFSSKITPRKFVSLTLTIFWLSILIWLLQIVRFCLSLKTINLVFLRCRESLFALNQIDSLSISKFNLSERQFRSLCDMNTLVSSENSIRFNRLGALLMSLMYSKKNRGPRINPEEPHKGFHFLTNGGHYIQHIAFCLKSNF